MKLVSLVSSGIDSPVATYMLSKPETDIILVHADNRPYTDDQEIDKFIQIAKHLQQKISGKIKVYNVPHGNTLSEIKQKCNNKFTCVLCKRMLLRYAEMITKREKRDAIVMGDSLGQVASQTLQNLRIVEQATQLPILRPLIGLDKVDITEIAKEIGTYDLSILPAQGCNAVPNKPSTSAKLDQILIEEEKIDVEKLVNEAIENSELITF